MNCFICGENRMYKCYIYGRTVYAKHTNCASKDEEIDFSIKEATIKNREVNRRNCQSLLE